jgi:precorrin-8X/cobalt-precorrin-8 methylmutase
MPYDYLRDPAEIYRRSFELIRAEIDLSRFPRELHAIALRLVHAVADTSILADLVWSDDAVCSSCARAVRRGVLRTRRVVRGRGAMIAFGAYFRVVK